jgi:hypothetical protein
MHQQLAGVRELPCNETAAVQVLQHTHCLVRYAPPVISPLCCRIRLLGLSVNLPGPVVVTLSSLSRGELWGQHCHPM